MDIKFSASNY